MAATQLIVWVLVLSPAQGDMGRVPELTAPLVDLSGSVFVLTPSDEELGAATALATAAWNEWEGAPIFAVGAGGIPVEWSSSLDVAAGWFPSSHIEVSTGYRPGIDCLRCALAHELGHVLGIPHGKSGPFGLAAGPPEERIR